MKILEIDITDFGIVEKATIDFTDKSLVVFSGKNGSGKSTILQALLMNIADTYKGSLAEYVRWGAKEFRVAIKFELHGVVYDSVIVGGTGSSRSLSFGEEIYRNSDAKKKLAELIDPSIFKSVAISSQGQVDLIETTPSERREHLKKVYDLNFVDQLQKLDAEIKELDSQLRLKENETLILTSKRYDKEELNLNVLSPEQLAELTISLEKNKSELKSLNDKLSLIKQKKQELTSIEAELQTIESNITKNETELLDLSSVDSKIQEIDKKIEFSKKESEEHLKDFDSQIETEKSKIKSYESSIESFLVKEKELSSQIKEEQTASFRTEIGLNSLKEKLKKMESGLCSECGRPYEAHSTSEIEKEIEVLSKKLEEERTFEAEQKKLQNELSEIKKNIEASKSLIEKSNNAIKLITSSIENEKFSLESKKSSYEREKKTIVESNESIKNKISEVLKDLFEQKNKKETSLSGLKAEIETLGPERPILGEVQDLEEEIESLNQKFNEDNAIRMSNESIEKRNKKILEDEIQDKKKLAELVDENSVLLKKKEVLLKTHLVFRKEFPTYVVSKLISDLQNQMNEFIKSTYGDRYEVSIVEEKDAIHILYGPNKADVKRASGYEQQVFSSGYRYAKERLLGFGLLVLDEVDSAADDGNSLQLYKTIAELPYDQVVVITHKEQTKDLLEKDYKANSFLIENGKISVHG